MPYVQQHAGYLSRPQRVVSLPFMCARMEEGKKVIFKIRPKTIGSHVHVQIFAGEIEGSLGLCGQVVMLRDEYDIFEAVMSSGATVQHRRIAGVVKVIIDNIDDLLDKADQKHAALIEQDETEGGAHGSE